MEKLSKVFFLAVSATVIFYCGAATKNATPDASADAGEDAGTVDAGTDSGTVDGGTDPCVICPDPCQDCPTPWVVDVYDIQTTPDASAVIHVPGFGQGVIIQGFLRAASGGGPYWSGNHEDCQPKVYDQPPAGYPNLQVPAVLFPEGIFRQCRIMVLRPQ